jgi:phosphate transport system permease protein
MAVAEAPPDEPIPASKPMSERARNRSELTGRDRVAHRALGFAALIPTIALILLTYVLVQKAAPAIKANGWHFFTTGTFRLSQGGYSTIQGKYGIDVILFGTVVCSLIALIIALPISVGGALLLVEKMPRQLQNFLGVFLELLAGIPSVVFGLWGYLSFGPFMSRTVFKWITYLHIPWFKGPITNPNQGLLTASLVLAAMIIPIIASTTRELIRSVPDLSKEGAIALGLTPSETVRLVTLPFVRTGILAAALLGWARALGETIAVLLISGEALNGYPHSAFDTFSTMAATIADLLDTALTNPQALESLAEVALCLLVITLITNFAGRLITTRLAGPGLPVGRGV